MPYHPRLENSSLFRDCFSLSRIIVFRKSDRAKVLTISIFHFLSPFFALLLPSYRYDSSRSSLSLSLSPTTTRFSSRMSRDRDTRKRSVISRAYAIIERRERARQWPRPLDLLDAQPNWMPGHLNRETRRLRLSRGGGAWESPFGPFIVQRFSFSVFPSSSNPLESPRRPAFLLYIPSLYP